MNHRLLLVVVALSGCVDEPQPNPDPDPDPSSPLFEVVKPAERDPRWATARCNDGTSFAAFVRRNPASTTWVINLQGGVMCDDDAIVCSQRLLDDPALTTTIPLADRAVVLGPDRGVLSRDPTINPDFADANHVLAHYCSSDFWTGTTTARRPTTGDPAQGWYFSGQANVHALIEILQDQYGLDAANPALRVLFAGNSAGAHGAHFNARWIHDRFPGRVMLFLDAGWMFDWDEPQHRIINTTTSDREVWRRATALWAGHLDPGCEAAAIDPIDCWFGVGWYPHVRALMPVFVQQSRRDSSIGGFLHGPGLDFARWQTAADASLTDVDWLWSGANVYHVLSGSDAGWRTGTSPDTLQEAVGRFWDGGAAERILF